MFTLIAFLTIAFTFTVMLFNIGSVARDTAQALQTLAMNSRASGRFAQSIAFAALWALIFVLSFA
jgi:hypothetical protein